MTASPPQVPAYPRIAVQNGRATVSLGALTRSRHCTFRCTFCYVNDDFKRGGRSTIQEVTEALREVNASSYEVILVSGDTDSFAPPRRSEGVALVEALSAFGKSVAFTTRALLSDEDIAVLVRSAERLRSQGKWLCAQTSLTQWTVPYLEPHPVPPAEARISQLRRLRATSLYTGVALRPLLPVVPLSDYTALLGEVAEYVDYVLIGTWFADAEGQLEKATLGDGPCSTYTVSDVRMDFDANTATWREYRSSEAEASCRAVAARLGVPLFDRTRMAFEWLTATSIASPLGG